jgi:hypothetical protein
VKIALGSEAELSTQVEAARRLGFLDEAVASTLLAEAERTRQMLHGLRRALERSLQISAGLASAGVLLVLVFVFV